VKLLRPVIASLLLFTFLLASTARWAATDQLRQERTHTTQFAPPQTLFDCRDTVKDFTGRETFDHFDNLGRAIARHRLHQKMDMIFVGTNL
jgi:hypothetical protein